MAKVSKKRKQALAKVDTNKVYTLAEASKLVKEISTTKFDSSVDLSIRLGVDPRKANQMVRGIVTLPHGTGKTTKAVSYTHLRAHETPEQLGRRLLLEK